MIQVSVILPTFNRQNQLQWVITGLEQQQLPFETFEVIVISDGSTDGTDAYLQALDTPLQLITLRQENQGAAAARNYGLQHASGQTILFLDDDVVPEPNLIAEHLRTHASDIADIVVLGPMLTPINFQMPPWVRWEQAMLEKQYEAMMRGDWAPTARQFYTGNASLPQTLLQAAGHFDTNFRRAEDVELAYRMADLGAKFVFNMEAVGYHYADRSFHSWLRTPYQYGRNDVIFARDKGQQWLLIKIFHEFRKRHLLTKLLTLFCLSRWVLRDSAIWLLRVLSIVAYWLRWERVQRGAYSGIYNLRHYQGIADELGGRKHFFERHNDLSYAEQQISIVGDRA